MSPDYRPQTAAATLQRVADGDDPWLAVGQFLDDWRREEATDRLRLVADDPPEVAGDELRWAALLAAAVDFLCAQDGVRAPDWVRRPVYRLAVPWFLYPGWRLRAWQLATTPVSFRMRNIFGGDRILARV
jgi:hypothetical protein